jgi:hypothetical protein
LVLLAPLPLPLAPDEFDKTMRKPLWVKRFIVVQQTLIKHAMGEETLTGTPKRVVILTNEGTEVLPKYAQQTSQTTLKVVWDVCFSCFTLFRASYAFHAEG